VDDLLLALGKHIQAHDEARIYWPPVEVLTSTRILQGYLVTYRCRTDSAGPWGTGLGSFKVEIAFEEIFGFMWQHFNKKEA